MDTPSFGKLLIVTGMVLVAVGARFSLLPRLGALGLRSLGDQDCTRGQGSGPTAGLPGDVLVKHDRFTFYFPLATCLLLSAVATLVLWLIARLGRK